MGLSMPRALWGRSQLYSIRQSCSSTWASKTEPNWQLFRNSSRRRPLKLSTQGFCQGQPGSMNTLPR